MNPFERWDDWEWERAIQEVGKERGRNGSGSYPKGTPRRYQGSGRPNWGNFLRYWNGTQKRSILAAMLFLLVFFSANNSDPFSAAVHSLYQSVMTSGNYYAALNGMAKETLSLGGIANKSTAVDAKLQGRLQAPISGQVIAAFGIVGRGGTNAVGSVHNGIDVSSTLGTPVAAPGAGVVTLVGTDPHLGKIVKIDLGDGWTTVLGNLGDISVRQGQSLAKGQVLGTVGLSAPLKKPWLHFELRKDNRPVNPLPYLAAAKI